ncbi:hypothetical protein [Roseospira navarrensis]|nr:hypothetical protein [Roseospira navarrensis]
MDDAQTWQIVAGRLGLSWAEARTYALRRALRCIDAARTLNTRS